MDLLKFFLSDNKNGVKTTEKFLIKNNNTLYNSIVNHINEPWFVELPFKEKIWYHIYDINSKQKCLHCEKDLKFGKSLKDGYGKYCSISCTNKSEQHKEKVKSTNNTKFGGNAPLSSETVKEKTKKTLLENYGVDNIFKNLEYIKEKTQLKHNVDHIAKLPTTKQKRAKTNNEKYGVITPILLEKHKNKQYKKKRDQFSKKYENLNIVNNVGDNIIINCPICCNNYTISRSVLYHRHTITDNPCTYCYPTKKGVSIGEKSLVDFISGLGVIVEGNNRTLISPAEIDIFLPEYNIAIEYNGLYWHSSKYTDSGYHLKKTELLNNIGIKLIHIFEDEWLDKSEIVKSRIKNLLSLTETKLYARKCDVRVVNTKDKTLFLNENHIQGAVGSVVNLGLYYNDQLVSIMTFSKKRAILRHKTKESEYELIRFCNKLNTSVVGGASKLLNHFIKNYQPKHIITYADRRWSTGKLYDKLGFMFNKYSSPNFYYVVNRVREHRLKYQKHLLVEKGYDKEKTADEIMSDLKIYKIFDCGTIRYSLTIGK